VSCSTSAAHAKWVFHTLQYNRMPCRVAKPSSVLNSHAPLHPLAHAAGGGVLRQADAVLQHEFPGEMVGTTSTEESFVFPRLDCSTTRPQVVAYYGKQTRSNSTDFRETGCACMAELARKIERAAIAPHVGGMLLTLLGCFRDSSWPVSALGDSLLYLCWYCDEASTRSDHPPCTVLAAHPPRLLPRLQLAGLCLSASLLHLCTCAAMSQGWHSSSRQQLVTSNGLARHVPQAQPAVVPMEHRFCQLVCIATVEPKGMRRMLTQC